MRMNGGRPTVPSRNPEHTESTDKRCGRTLFADSNLFSCQLTTRNLTLVSVRSFVSVNRSMRTKQRKLNGWISFFSKLYKWEMYEINKLVCLSAVAQYFICEVWHGWLTATKIVMNSLVDDQIYIFSEKTKVIREVLEITRFLNVMKCLQQLCDGYRTPYKALHHCELQHFMIAKANARYE